MTTTSDYFKIFKIKKITDIDKEELKRRFRILVQKYHPDKPVHGSQRKFVLIQDAYAYLKREMESLSNKETKKFFNKRFSFYGTSVFDNKTKRWVKIKGKRINIKV